MAHGPGPALCDFNVMKSESKGREAQEVTRQHLRSRGTAEGSQWDALSPAAEEAVDAHHPLVCPYLPARLPEDEGEFAGVLGACSGTAS